MCECIKVTYQLVKEEPVTVEVEKNNDGNYYFDGYEIQKESEDWQVTSSCLKEVVIGVASFEGVESEGVAVKVDVYNGDSVYLSVIQNNIEDPANISVIFFDGTKWIQRIVNGSVDVAESTDFITWTSLLEGYEVISTTVTTQPVDCISVNYGETTIEVLKVGVFKGQNVYAKGFNPIDNNIDCAIFFQDTLFSDGESWHLVFNEYVLTPIDGTVYILPKSPFINPPISENWLFANGENLGAVTTTYCDCGELQATLSEATPCPFGTYTIEEGSIFEAFSVQPCGCSCVKLTYELDGATTTVDLTSSPYEFTAGGDLFSIILTGSVWKLIWDDVTIGTIDTPNCPLGDFDLNEDSPFSRLSISKCENSYKTITYSTVSEGWNSFWSYKPDWMVELNNVFYTFKNGNIWRQNTNITRNNFYGTQYTSKVKTIFNNNPLENKMFKSLAINSTEPWSVSIATNLETSNTPSTYFVEKEGFWFSYIRRQDNTIAVKALSTQGVGAVTSVTAPNIVNFSFNLDLSSISVGDKLYKNNSGSLVYLGEITALTVNSITLDITFGGLPSVSDFIICVKNSQVESYGTRGVYMNIELESDSTEELELFSISSTVFKSFQ